jgi:hypothetical protein
LIKIREQTDYFYKKGLTSRPLGWETGGTGDLFPPHICDRIREYFQGKVFNTPRLATEILY